MRGGRIRCIHCISHSSEGMVLIHLTDPEPGHVLCAGHQLLVKRKAMVILGILICLGIYIEEFSRVTPILPDCQASPLCMGFL